MPSLPRATFEIPFDAGLLTRGDKRAKDAPAAERLLNAEFDDIGGLRVRYPFDTVRTALVGGGTLANARKFAMNGDELVCFTATGLYSWVPAESGWTYRGDHLAVATDEETVFATPGDQDYADRVELNGHIVYCWQTSTDGVRIAVRDKTTGAVVQGPTTIRPSSGYVYVQPRLVALNNCVMLFWINFVVLGATTLMAAKITVNPYTYTVAGSPIATPAGSTFYYDVCRIPGRDRCYVALAQGGSSSGYTITSVDESFAGATTTAITFAGTGPIAIAVSPDAAYCTVVAANIKADVWNVTAAGTALTILRLQVALASGGIFISSISQITAAYRLTQDGGQYRCYAFWSNSESDTVPATTVFDSDLNWIDATGAIGAPAAFVYGLGIAARAFARDSHVYLVGTFAGLSFAGTDPSGTYSELQNTYYLYRDDAFLVAKAAWGEGGGFHASGWLPNVVVDASNANAMVFMGGIRRIVPVGPNANLSSHPSNYAERAPREITFTYDDDRARRCVRFGEALYVLGGLVLQYDGAQLVELGTCTYPWLVDVSAGSSGGIAAAGYSYKVTDRWTNAKGETDRSTTATVSNITLGSPNSIEVSTPNLYITRKTGVAIEAWRTEGAPVPGAPFFLVTSQDPSVITGDNNFLANDPTSSALVEFVDDLTDAQIAILPANPENGAVLSALEPPPATIAFTDSQRVYLAGIPGYPNTVYYSKYRQAGLVAAFSDSLTFDTPTDGGAITAIGYNAGVLIVWCASATYAFAGAGNDDTGGGADFQLSQIVSDEVGAQSPEATVFCDDGWYVKTARGWYLLDRGQNYTYVGAGVYRYDDELVLAAVTMKTRHQLRVVTPNRVLVLDTLVKQWTEWTISDGLDMLLDASNACWYLTPTGPRPEITTWDGYGGTDASLAICEIETTWIKPGGQQQGRYVVDYVQLLGEYRSTCVVRMQLAKDYEQTAPGVPNWHTDKTWTPTPTTDGNGLERRTSPIKKRCASLKARISITAADGVSPLGGPCIRLTSLTGLYAVEPGIYSAISAAQKN